MRIWLRRLTATGLMWCSLGTASQARAGSTHDPATAPALAGQEAAGGSAAAQIHDDGRRTMRRFPVNFLRGTVGIVSTDNIRPLLIGGAATGSGAIFDDQVAEAIADPENNFGQLFEGGAHPAVFGAAVTVLFAVGRTVEAPRFRDVTYDWMEAYFLNAGLTNVLKVAVGRERPNGEDHKSFPSGHASTAFTLAAVAERHFGWKVGLPAYTVAGLVAVSRLQRNKHYLSDVMAGATLGYIVGRTVVRVNGEPLDAPRGSQVSLAPVITKQTRALIVRVTF
jgi:membrane-associated phospholipid phosphatase